MNIKEWPTFWFFHSKVFPYICLLMVVFVIYSNVYSNAFLFDDDLIIVHNDWLRHGSTLPRLLTSSTTAGAHIVGGFYRPLQLLLYFFVFQLTGLSTPAFHFLNIVLHALNGCLLYALGLKLGFDKKSSLIAALLWVVHPLHTEAVTYMSATADPLSTGCTFLCCLILLPDASTRRILTALPVLFLGLLSKETTAILPLLAALCLFYAPSPETPLLQRLRLSTHTWPLWLTCVAYFFWRIHLNNFDGPYRYETLFNLPSYASLKMHAEHLEYRIYTTLATLPAYLQLIVWPQELHMERSFTIYTTPRAWPVLLGFFILMAVLVIVGRYGRQERELSWGLLWFLGAQIPTSSLIVPVNSLFLEHWMYLPTSGLFMGLAGSLGKHYPKYFSSFLRCSLLGLFLGVLLALSARTLKQNAVWHDPISFYNNIFAYGPSTARAHNNMALAYMQKKDFVKAVQEFQTAIQLEDIYAETHYNLALTLLAIDDGRDRESEVIAQLERSVEIDPNFYRSYEALAALYASNNQMDRATYYAEKAAATKSNLIHSLLPSQ